MFLSNRRHVFATTIFGLLSLNVVSVTAADVSSSSSNNHHNLRRELAPASGDDDVFCLSSSSRESSDDDKLFDKMFVFGDSLSDTGNNLQFTPCIPGILPLYCGDTDGRASDGDVIPEYIMNALTKQTSLDPAMLSTNGQTLDGFVPGATNFAVSGATAGNYNPSRSSLVTQVDSYLAAKAGGSITPTSDDLHYIDIGANDASAALAALLEFGPNEFAMVVQIAITAVVTQITRLINEGHACNIMFLNSFDVGGTPQAKALGQQAASIFTSFVDNFNSGIAGLTSTLPQDYCGNDIKIIDANTIEKDFRSDPTLPLVDLEGVCNNKFIGDCNADNFLYCFSGSVPTSIPGQCYCSLPIFAPTISDCGNQYAFYDEIHPTTAFNGLFVDKVLESLVCV